ncbi:hypothetical protein NDU88_004470 [Pleurodeles waltl]|uniref:Uncharacterized protein n=1 Tax=Pleurodeles waltl TaxID=8319 RepID=A0AAV7QG93_PLEWA|nr:hypothetical protein NDU88_004470 [Pleurodeles waltl]
MRQVWSLSPDQFIPLLLFMSGQPRPAVTHRCGIRSHLRRFSCREKDQASSRSKAPAWRPSQDTNSAAVPLLTAQVAGPSELSKQGACLP